MPGLAADRFVGSIAYADGQFDDARYNLALSTPSLKPAAMLSITRAYRVPKDANGKLETAAAEDQFSQHRFTLRATRFINATGPAPTPFANSQRRGSPQRCASAKARTWFCRWMFFRPMTPC